MGYWVAAALTASTAASILQGFSSRNTAYNNADAIQQSALTNANIGTTITNYNNKLRLFNGRLAALAGFSSAAITETISQYDAEILLRTAAYNSALIDEEQKTVYEALDLDLMQFHKSMAEYQGEYIASIGASGISVGWGSNKEVLLKMKTEEALNATILRHNADVKWAELENAKRQGTWQAKVKATQLIWEGNLQANAARLQGMLSLASNAASSIIASQQNIISNTASIYNAGISAQNYYNHGNISFVNSLFQAAQYGARTVGSFTETSMIRDFVTQQNVAADLETSVFSDSSLF